MSDDEDDSNPMHKMGYGRGDDAIPTSRRTQAYSFVLPKTGEKKVEPTQPSPDTLTVKDVITKLIEANSEAWARLPTSVKDALIERPQDFQFITVSPGGRDLVNILYNGVVLRYTGNLWAIDKIVR